MTGHVHSYPSIYAIGHAAIADIFDGPVVVEEKIDGSQFSFGLIDGALCCRSKGQQLLVDAPEKMFAAAVESVKGRADLLRPGWTYRGEYLQKPKHNTLAYSRIPRDHIILYDINPGLEGYLSPVEKTEEALRIGYEVVPVFHHGVVSSLDELKALAERESCLGGATMEGVVVKNYARFTKDKKAMLGKYVREAFKEAHSVAWKASNPALGDIVERLIESYKTPARWQKAVQHRREAGALEGSPRDIGALMKEVPADVLKECRDEIAAKLFEYAWPKIARGIVAGLPQWYKDELAQSAFAPSDAPEATAA